MTDQQANEIYQKLGARIGSARRRAKITQEGLAEEIGLTRTSVVNIEKGRQKLLVHTLIAVSQHLHTTAAELLEGLETVDDDSMEPRLQAYSPHVQDFILSGGAKLKQQLVKHSRSEKL